MGYTKDFDRDNGPSGVKIKGFADMLRKFQYLELIIMVIVQK